MKKVLIGILLFVAVCGVIFSEHNYTRKDCEVIEVKQGTALIEDKCGYIWKYEDEGFEVGEIVELKMHDNYTTSYVDDDFIKKVVKKA